jgi:hypothetical protein
MQKIQLANSFNLASAERPIVTQQSDTDSFHDLSSSDLSSLVLSELFESDTNSERKNLRIHNQNSAEFLKTETSNRNDDASTMWQQLNSLKIETDLIFDSSAGLTK